MDDELFVKLRDCFTAGYTLPQYCIDNGIKKPLFVSEEKYKIFLWEVYVQFKYDRRLQAGFCFINDEEAKLNLAGHHGLIRGLKIQHFSETMLDLFDKIILLTSTKLSTTSDKVISLEDLQEFFVKKTYIEIPLLNFLKYNPKVKLFLTNFPDISRYKGGKEFNSKLWEAKALALKIMNNKGNPIKTPLDKFGYTNSQVVELILSSKVKRNLDGTTSMLKDDYLGAISMLKGDYLLRQIRNGKRLTAYQPKTYQNKIFFFGSCHHYGINAPYDKTIESYLQEMLNKNNLPYRVENESQHFVMRYQDIFYNLNKISPAPGDIIFFWIVNLHSNNDDIPFCDVSDVFDPPNDFREIFCRKSHVNELGYKLLAERYFKFLTENNFFRDIEFNYPIPPPRITDMVYLLGQKKAA